MKYLFKMPNKSGLAAALWRYRPHPRNGEFCELLLCRRRKALIKFNDGELMATPLLNLRQSVFLSELGGLGVLAVKSDA